MATLVMQDTPLLKKCSINQIFVDMAAFPTSRLRGLIRSLRERDAELRNAHPDIYYSIIALGIGIAIGAIAGIVGLPHFIHRGFLKRGGV